MKKSTRFCILFIFCSASVYASIRSEFYAEQNQNNFNSPSDVCPENYKVTSQHDVDYFNAYYSDCTSIKGSLRVTGAANQLTKINLVNIGGDLTVKGMKNLTDLSDILQNIQSIAGALKIESNTGLQKVGNFSKLTNVKEIDVINNPELIHLQGFSHIKSLESLDISENASLLEISEAFTNLETISSEQAQSKFVLSNNDSLADIVQSFTQLKKAEAEIEIGNNPMLQSLTGSGSASFQQLTETGGLYIHDNPELLDAGSFRDLTGIGRYYNGKSKGLRVMNNAKLGGLQSFNHLRIVRANMSIKDNQSLLSFDGFQKVLKISGKLTISNNYQLNSVQALGNILQLGVNNQATLRIEDNRNLEDCSVLAHLKNNDRKIILQGNGGSCNGGF